MNLLKKSIFISSLLLSAACAINADVITNVVEWNTGYFVDEASNTTSDPYYRWYDQDWGWSHSTISETFTSATLSISAYDVDAGSGSESEWDDILVYENSADAYVSVGYLAGNNNIYSYTTFTLGSEFYDDIASGLKVKIDIDQTHTYDYWAVTLAKSVLSLDGAELPDPNPNPVPEPSTAGSIIIGLASIAGYMIRKRK